MIIDICDIFPAAPSAGASTELVFKRPGKCKGFKESYVVMKSNCGSTEYMEYDKKV